MSGGNSLDLDAIFVGSDKLAEMIANKWLEWNAARAPALERWKETTQYVYATSTRETSNALVGGHNEDDESEVGWSHSTHVPKITQIHDNLGANYMVAVHPHDDFFKWVGHDSSAVLVETRKKVEAYLKSKHRLSKLRLEIRKIIDDINLYGNAFARVRYVSEVAEGTPSVLRMAYKGPKVERISPYDIVFNPLADSFQNTPKIIRTLKSIGELMRDLEESPEDKAYLHDNIALWQNMRSGVRKFTGDEFNKHCQLQFDGFGTASQYFNSDTIELLTFYGDIYDMHTNTFYKNHVITVIDKTYVIRKEAIKTANGRPHIYHAGWRTRPDNLWAMGPLDNLIGMQYLVNHLENARADGFDQMLEPTRILVGDVETDGVYAGRPGGEYRIPSGEGSVSNLVPDTTVLTADNQIELKMNQMEAFAGSPREEMGIRTPGEKTLGEVMQLHQSATKVFRDKVILLEAFVEDLLNAELQVARDQNDISDLIDVLGDDGVTDFINITKEDLISNGKLVPVGSRIFERRQQLVSNLQMLQGTLLQDQLALQHVSSIRLAQMFEELADLDDLEVVQPFVRVGEMAQLTKLQMAAQTQIENEDAVDLGGDLAPTQTEQAQGPSTGGAEQAFAQ